MRITDLRNIFGFFVNSIDINRAIRFVLHGRGLGSHSFILIAIVTVSGWPGITHAQFLGTKSPQQQTDEALVYRFRPMVKTGAGESWRPATWQFIVQNSSLMWSVGINPTQTMVPVGSWSSDYHELTSTVPPLGFGGDLSKSAGSSTMWLQVNSSAYGGEGWPQVVAGDGIYAHVQAFGNIVNIEYTVLWALNHDELTANVHGGDITSMVVLYDRASDQLLRLSYSIHGCAIFEYRLLAGQKVTPAVLAGQDVNQHPTESDARRVDVDSSNEGHHTSGGCDSMKIPDPHVFLLPDPITQRYEHPAVYSEEGTHEFFPNGTGEIVDGGEHNGTGVSYVPTNVVTLGSFATPTSPNIPFVHYNGKFGSDPATIVLHHTWCWPTTDCTNNVGFADSSTYSMFTDPNPYAAMGSLSWPETKLNTSSGDVYSNSTIPAPQGTGDVHSPFGDLMTAYTFTPASWTIHLQHGAYGGRNIWLNRPMIFQATGGPVILGAL